MKKFRLKGREKPPRRSRSELKAVKSKSKLKMESISKKRGLVSC